MTKHRHAEMIKAKADNMELVVFHNAKEPNEWTENVERLIPGFREDWDYFLCLPQHKDAVLNCLNGGVSEVFGGSGNFCRGDAVIGSSWRSCSLLWYMNDTCESRTKHRKEKRWIAIKKGNKEVGRYTCETLEEAKDMYIPRWWSHHEVEIEVEV